MRQTKRARRLLASIAAVALAVPALGQDRQVAQPAGQEVPGNSAAAQPAQQNQTAAPDAEQSQSDSARESAARSSDDLFSMPPPPVEYPSQARRDPASVGRLDPVQLGLGERPWGDSSGAFLSTLMRRMDTPLASRWAHIALRDLLLSRTQAPRHSNPVDWVAERAWLLLRLGEADGARMLVAGVDVDQFTPKMHQVGVQSALANADPAALCPLQSGIEEVEPQIYQLVDAMCAALAGEPEAASSQIDSARRRGRMANIDVTLAQKVVGVATDTGRAVSVVWDPVERLNAWRFGLATATGMLPPDRLIDDSPLQLRAWQSRAPLLAPADRWPSALIAGGLGVLSSQALTDLQALIYDSTGPDELSQTDGWQLRLAFVGNDPETRIAAMRKLWDGAEGSLQREAVRAMLGRAASRVQPAAQFEADAPEIISSLLAAGMDREAAAWSAAVGDMEDRQADRAWAMLALAAPEGADIDRSLGRIEDFIDRDESRQRKRSAFLVAGLAGLGHIDAATASRLNERFGLRLERRTRWTRIIDRASARGQSGTVVLLSATGLQARDFEDIPSAHLFHSVAALARTGQDFTARMLAAEALSRT